MEHLVRIQGMTFELVRNERNGWNPEAFRERYSDVLNKYDFIVGDWGYGQLRLKGFYNDHNKRVPFEQKIGALDEYIQEYCNFGCAYFVVQKIRQPQNDLADTDLVDQGTIPKLEDEVAE